MAWEQVRLLLHHRTGVIREHLTLSVASSRFCVGPVAGATGTTAQAAVEQLEAGVESNAFNNTSYLRTAFSVVQVRAHRGSSDGKPILGYRAVGVAQLLRDLPVLCLCFRQCDATGCDNGKDDDSLLVPLVIGAVAFVAVVVAVAMVVKCVRKNSATVGVAASSSPA